MKKAKSQAVASSVEENKNGQQLIAPHLNFSVSSPMIEDDPDEVFLEASPSSNAFGRGVIVPGGGVTANLSRNKAMPLQPGKKSWQLSSIKVIQKDLTRLVEPRVVVPSSCVVVESSLIYIILSSHTSARQSMFFQIRLLEEHEQCLLYLDASTIKPLLATVEMQLLERHISAILDKGFIMLMDGKHVEDLQRMYLLFLRVNALERLRQFLGQYIRRTGQGIVMDEEKEKDTISSLLEFKENLDRIWEESFNKNEAFVNTIQAAFEHLINLRQNRPVELISKFVDEKLRTGNKGASEEELEGTLDKGKDIFEAFYKIDLSKRLVLGKSASIDAEKSVITKN